MPRERQPQPERYHGAAACHHGQPGLAVDDEERAVPERPGSRPGRHEPLRHRHHHQQRRLRPQVRVPARSLDPGRRRCQPGPDGAAVRRYRRNLQVLGSRHRRRQVHYRGGDPFAGHDLDRPGPGAQGTVAADLPAGQDPGRHRGLGRGEGSSGVDQPAGLQVHHRGGGLPAGRQLAGDDGRYVLDPDRHGHRVQLHPGPAQEGQGCRLEASGQPGGRGEAVPGRRGHREAADFRAQDSAVPGLQPGAGVHAQCSVVRADADRAAVARGPAERHVVDGALRQSHGLRALHLWRRRTAPPDVQRDRSIHGVGQQRLPNPAENLRHGGPAGGPGAIRLQGRDGQFPVAAGDHHDLLRRHGAEGERHHHRPGQSSPVGRGQQRPDRARVHGRLSQPYGRLAYAGLRGPVLAPR